MNSTDMEKMLVAMVFPLEMVVCTRSVQGRDTLGLTQDEVLQGQGVMDVGSEVLNLEVT